VSRVCPAETVSLSSLFPSPLFFFFFSLSQIKERNREESRGGTNFLARFFPFLFPLLRKVLNKRIQGASASAGALLLPIFILLFFG